MKKTEEQISPLAVVDPEEGEMCFVIGRENQVLARPDEYISDEEVLVVEFSGDNVQAVLISPGGFKASDLARELNAWFDAVAEDVVWHDDDGTSGVAQYCPLGDHIFVETISKSKKRGVDLDIWMGS